MTAARRLPSQSKPRWADWPADADADAALRAAALTWAPSAAPLRRRGRAGARR